MLRISHIVVAVLLSGCAQTQLHNPNVTNEQAERDLAACRYEANLVVQGVRDGLERAIRANDLAIECMKLRGYTTS